MKKAESKNTPLYLTKLTIDNYDKIQAHIEEYGSVTSFLKSTIKFITITIGKPAIVYYSHYDVFYIILSNIEKEIVLQKLEKLKRKRKLQDLNITFSMGVVAFQENDGFNSINKRCDTIHEVASF